VLDSSWPSMPSEIFHSSLKSKKVHAIRLVHRQWIKLDYAFLLCGLENKNIIILNDASRVASEWHHN
jgi:hypothetical protein